MKCRLFIRPTLTTRVNRLREEVQSGMTTAEYAVGTLRGMSAAYFAVDGVWA